MSFEQASKPAKVKIGWEVASINKYHQSAEDIEKAILNVGKYGIDVGMFLLLSPEQGKEDILDNIRFIARHKLNIRVNIVREYEGAKYSVNGLATPYAELKQLSALAYSASFMGHDLGIDIFSESAMTDLVRRYGYAVRERIPASKVYDVIGGRQNFGFKTSRWLSGMKYILSRHFGAPVKIDYDHDKKQISNVRVLSM